VPDAVVVNLFRILFTWFFCLFCRFALELHAVHQNSKGETAVIGIWYKIGRPDRLLSKVCCISQHCLWIYLHIHDFYRV